ncbi:MAG: hypothetical protein H6Q41_4444 [Deltaproteobacteria bacterium]|jgi:hypothetical protein|nr:hypothetical protein [Deltaproteobacteria bacterium]
MGEGEGGGGQNKNHLVPPPLHPLPRWGGEKVSECFRRFYLVTTTLRCVIVL